MKIIEKASPCRRKGFSMEFFSLSEFFCVEEDLQRSSFWVGDDRSGGGGEKVFWGV